MALHNIAGQKGEAAAADHMRGLGYRVCDTNWKCGHLEVDVICCNRHEVVFVEVKTRSSQFNSRTPEQYVDIMKQRRMIVAANAYMKLKGLNDDHRIRFDIIGIDATPDGEVLALRHYPSAFIPHLRTISEQSYSGRWRWAHRTKTMMLLLLFGLMSLLTACHTPERDARRIERDLHVLEAEALSTTHDLCRLLSGTDTSFDSIWATTHHSDRILYYIFDHGRLLYWSDNWLAAEDVVRFDYDHWWYRRFDNAHAIGRWTQNGHYDILTVIPVRYAYPIANRQLHNHFIPPLTGTDRETIARTRQQGFFPVHSTEGDYLFSIGPANDDNQGETETEADTESSLSRTFSYRRLIAGEESDDHALFLQHDRVRTWLIVLGILLLIFLSIASVILYRSHGFRNLRLRYKILFLFMALLAVFMAYLFTISIITVRRNYEERQKILLADKSRYIQSALQSLYYWDMQLSPANTAGLNIDLRELCYTYKADIHVYDLNGTIVGSSSPELFTRGIISRHISPEPFFTECTSMVHYEQIGHMRYLAAYTPFYNGAMVPLGYISVPSFISQEELHLESDQYLMHLLPPCVLLLVLAIFISYAVARALTRPLSNITDSMRHLRLGEGSNHIEYHNRDEIGELVIRYNEMVDQLAESTSRLARSERETAWRTMARQIAHEINNPLTPMRLRVQQLQRLQQEGDERFDQYFRETARMLVEQIDDLSRIATSFSTFAKMPEVKATDVDVAQRLSSVIYLMSKNEQNIPVRYVGPDSGVIARADGEQLSEVFTNLIKNALQALEGRTDGDVIVMLTDREKEVEVRISDNGPGIPPEAQDKIFLPNFTTKSTGAGLGLAICKNIVEGADGQIKYETSEKGTIFFVYFKKKQ